MINTPTVWAIGGIDPIAGAGLLIDSQAIRCFGIHPAVIVTAVTAQNNHRFYGRYFPVDPKMIASQAEALAEDGKPAAIKTGMLATPEIVESIANVVEKFDTPLIIDPVLRSSSGFDLLPPTALPLFLDKLVSKAALITPNKIEAEILTGIPLLSPHDYPKAAQWLLDRGVGAVLIKDGHGTGEYCYDYFSNGKKQFWLKKYRLNKSVRGTGCCLASAIAASLPLVKEVEEAVIVATAFTNKAIRLAQPYLSFSTWPADAEDMPRLVDTIDHPHLKPFPSTGDSPLGCYPVVPSASWVKKLIDCGATTIQLRVKEGSKEHIEKEIIEGIKYARNTNCRLFINDYWQLALKHKAYGVHLGQEDILTADWKQLSEAGIRLGISTHSYEELAIALRYNPSYIALGPIFPTLLKKMPFAPQGIDKITIWSRLTTLPIVAIGGMTLATAPPAIRAGASGVACVNDIINAKNPENKTKEWIAACENTSKELAPLNT